MQELRKCWSDVEITFRGNGAFCRHKMFNWCKRNNVSYIVGIPCNNRIMNKVKPYLPEVKELFNKTNEIQRLFGKFGYATKTWKKDRRVIVKAECNKHGLNTLYIVTNLNGELKLLYDSIYCTRGEMENRIKEQELCLFADRTSSKNWLTNQFRLLLSATVVCILCLKECEELLFKKLNLQGQHVLLFG